MRYTLANNVRVTLASGLANNSTSIIVNNAVAPYNNPPAPVGGVIGVITLTDSIAAPTKYEIVTYTGVTDNGNGTRTLTGCIRGIEGTTAQSWDAGNVAFQSATAGTLSLYRGEVAITSGTITGTPISGSTGAFTVVSSTGNATFGTASGDNFGVRMHGNGGTQFVAAGNVSGVPTIAAYTAAFAGAATLQLQQHGGALNIGGNTAVTGAVSASGVVTGIGGLYAGNGLTTVQINADGKAGDSTGGVSINARVAGTTLIAIGNKSNIIGGAYDATPMLYGNAPIQVNVGMFVTNGDQGLAVQDAAGTTRRLTYRTGGLPRWQIVADSTAESGSNAGTGLGIYRFNDAGGYIDTVLYIPRETGMVIAYNGLRAAGPATIGATTSPGLISYEYPVTRHYIGDGTGYSFALSRRISSVTTDVFTVTDGGSASLSGNLTLTSTSSVGTAYRWRAVDGAVEGLLTCNSAESRVYIGSATAHNVGFLRQGSVIAEVRDTDFRVHAQLFLNSGNYLHHGSFGRIWSTAATQIGSTSQAGLYGPLISYNAKLSSGWKSIGGGTASALTFDEGYLSFATSQGVGAADVALTWTSRFVVAPNGNTNINGEVLTIGTGTSAIGANVRFTDDGNTSRWLAGILGGAGQRSWVLYDIPQAAARITVDATTGHATFSKDVISANGHYVSDVFAMTAVTTSSQTRTMDLANGTVQTIAADQAFTLNITGPAGRAAFAMLYLFNNGGAAYSVTVGTGWFATWGGTYTNNQTHVMNIYWDGYRAVRFSVLNNSSSGGGDFRPT